LLKKDPSQRLGFHNEFEEVKRHAFFKNLNWHELLRKEKDGPLKPNFSKFYFDREYI
jgi:hypothetical protein